MDIPGDSGQIDLWKVDDAIPIQYGIKVNDSGNRGKQIVCWNKEHKSNNSVIWLILLILMKFF